MSDKNEEHRQGYGRELTEENIREIVASCEEGLRKMQRDNISGAFIYMKLPKDCSEGQKAAVAMAEEILKACISDGPAKVFSLIADLGMFIMTHFQREDGSDSVNTDFLEKDGNDKEIV